MYCSTCGLAIADSLSYCNHCGARLSLSNSDKVASTHEVKPGLLISAMVATFILGLLAIAFLLGVMKVMLGLESGQVLGFAALSFLIMLFLEGVFLRLLFRRSNSDEERARTELRAGQTTKELGAPQLHALREPPLSSVTDQTTRAFDPIYIKHHKATSAELD